MDLGTTIKYTRKKRGITQTEFAGRCGITQAYLSKIENNLKDPNLSLITKLSQELEIPTPILFFLSITPDDVPENKREDFAVLAPAINSFIDELFTLPESTT